MDKILNLLGLAYAARKMVLGEEVLNGMNRVKLVLVASDISEKSRERVDKKCYYYHVDIIDNFSSDDLSAAIGKATVKLIGITDKGFAQSIKSKIN